MEQPQVSATPTDQTATPATQGPVSNAGTAPIEAESSTPKPSYSGSSNTEAPAPGEESFTDPNSVPPELKSKYDSMLSDYKKKTEEIAQQRRDYEAAVEKAKLVDMIASDPDMVAAWNKKYGGQQEQAQQAPDPAQEVMQIRQEVSNLKASNLVKDFKASHPDFAELDSDGLISGYVQVNPPRSEREWNTTLEKAYNYAKSVTGKWIEKGKKDGLTRVSEKAAQASLAPSSSPQQPFTGDPKKLSVAEAVELARKGIRVS